MCASITCKITVLIVNQVDFLISFHYSDSCNILTCYCLLSLLSHTLLPFVTDTIAFCHRHTLLPFVTYVIAFGHIRYCLLSHTLLPLSQTCTIAFCHRRTLLPFDIDILCYCFMSHMLLSFVT